MSLIKMSLEFEDLKLFRRADLDRGTIAHTACTQSGPSYAGRFTISPTG